jgi:protein phosphatase
LGGHSRGKTASQTAINQIIKLLNQQYFDDASLALKTAILHANQEIASLNHNKLELKRMGTTVVSALYRDGQIHLAHVGDSRIYLLRNGILRQLTHDHTYVQKLVDSQIITPQEAREHPKRSHLTQAVGVYYDTRPELAPHPLACQTGDILLLCTDGLTEMLDETEITETLLHTEGLQMTAETLVEQAKMAGGQDNITAMLVRIN